MIPRRYDANDPDGWSYPGQMRIGYFPTPADSVVSSPIATTTPPPAASVAPSPAKNAAQHELTGAERLDLIGSALQDFGNSLAGRPPNPADIDAWHSQFQHQQDAFAQRIGFQQMPGPYHAVTSATLQPLAGSARPGDRALGAMAALYR